MKCEKCNGDVQIYKFEKCSQCGTVHHNFKIAPIHARKLKITIDKETKEVWIKGDKSGLEYLADCCLRIIGKKDPSGHILLQWQMNTLMEGSVESRLEYSDDPEDYT